MKIVSIINIVKNTITIGSNIIIQGWVRTIRTSKTGISFIGIYDGSCNSLLQIIAYDKLSNYKNEILRITSGCSLVVTGVLKKSPGIGQYFELEAYKIKVIGWIKNPDSYPISAKYHTLEHLREFAHLRPRTSLIGAITRVRHTLAQAIHRFLSEQGFFWVTTPIITTSDTEGAGEMFRVSTLDYNKLPRNNIGEVDFTKDFFGNESFLTVSGQLNCEAYALAMSKVYTFGPVFRAEKSNTSRHLAEFWMVEPEVAFASLNEIIIIAEKMLKYIFNAVLVERYDDMLFFVRNIDKKVIVRIESFKNFNFTQIEYHNAIEILNTCNKKFEKQVFWGIDLSSEHERYLTENYFNSPVIIKNYPKDIKAFYMRLNEDNKTVAAFDILMPGVGEIIGGSQREERCDMLDNRLDEMSIKKENYQWYRDLRCYGTVPHSGFGLGFDRLISYVTGVSNLREVVPFPRTQRSALF
ncbi:Asparagine--tRNA ligase [Candidatus Providencia siddallii]|uniref:Asparagine--tRNA ligase n=1 Tax=Candidatus Providencia siddallii TaxID=1715285 RepID=A0A0M6W9N4_9GAMM|nr:Asparagine--tRNA ligase [Candidatus Providencia siddallii]